MRRMGRKAMKGEEGKTTKDHNKGGDLESLLGGAVEGRVRQRDGKGWGRLAPGFLGVVGGGEVTNGHHKCFFFWGWASSWGKRMTLAGRENSYLIVKVLESN